MVFVCYSSRAVSLDSSFLFSAGSNLPLLRDLGVTSVSSLASLSTWKIPVGSWATTRWSAPCGLNGTFNMSSSTYVLWVVFPMSLALELRDAVKRYMSAVG